MSPTPEQTWLCICDGETFLGTSPESIREGDFSEYNNIDDCKFYDLTNIKPKKFKIALVEIDKESPLA